MTNAHLKADDVPTMIHSAMDAPWHVVGHEEDLLTTDDLDLLLWRAEELYRHFRDAGLGLDQDASAVEGDLLRRPGRAAEDHALPPVEAI